TTISSIYINPTQFNNTEDFKKYPVTLEQDIFILEKNGCDILFLPDTNKMYPDGIVLKNNFDLGYLETILEGKFRPGHFQGVSHVVNRLLELVAPTHLFVGQKDYQQCMVIKRLMELQNFNTKLIVCPTLREKSGLAMSSRNMRLTEQEKECAVEIYKTLISVQQKIEPGSLQHLKKEALEYLIKKKITPDYLEISDAKNLTPVSEWDGITDLVILAAAFVGDIRLIDNILIQD
ncbi:MAG TPA: pantoate--beta-alanine ligase, partial [Chitinophagaceae bacterium]|nr:pantoate--beta-alanine ligase [Chitinophagaceae bacterium]